MKNESIRKVINVEKHNYSPVWTFKQEDDGVLKLELFKGSIPLDLTGQTIKLGVIRANKTLVELEDQSCFKINNNELDITLKNNILSAAGIAECDLELIDKDGKMTTASFFININKKTIGSNSIQASNEISSLEKLKNDFKSDVEDMKEEYNSWKDTVLAENNVAKLQNEINGLGSQLDNIVNVISLRIEDFGAIPNDKSVNNETAFNKCIEYIKNNKYKKAIIKASAESYYFGDGEVNFTVNPLSDKLTDNGIVILEGNGFTTFKKKGNNTLFNFKYGSVYFKDFTCESLAHESVGIDNVKSIAFNLGVNNSNSIDGVITGSYFQNIKTYRFNKHFNIARMFDTQFSNCGGYVIYGENGAGLNFEGHTFDNTNNINFYRCHFEGTNHSTQSLLKIEGNNLIPIINFFGCHFENNGSINSNVLNINRGQCINFNGCQITNNGWDNTDLKSIIINKSLVNFNNCLFQKNVFVSNKLFNLINSTVLVNGGYAFSQNNSNNLSGLFDSDEVSRFITSNFMFNNTENDLNNNLLSINHNDYNNRRYEFEIDKNTTSLLLNFKETVGSTAPKLIPLEYTRKGKLNPYKGYTGKTQTIDNGGSYEFDALDSSDNSRGSILIQCSIPGNNGALLIYSDGSTLYNITTNTLFNLNSIEPSKINVEYNAGKIKITNNYGSDRKFTVIPFNFN